MRGLTAIIGSLASLVVVLIGSANATVFDFNYFGHGLVFNSNNSITLTGSVFGTQDQAGLYTLDQASGFVTFNGQTQAIQSGSGTYEPSTLALNFTAVDGSVGTLSQGGFNFLNTIFGGNAYSSYAGGPQVGDLTFTERSSTVLGTPGPIAGGGISALLALGGLLGFGRWRSGRAVAS